MKIHATFGTRRACYKEYLVGKILWEMIRREGGILQEKWIHQDIKEIKLERCRRVSCLSSLILSRRLKEIFQVPGIYLEIWRREMRSKDRDPVGNRKKTKHHETDSSDLSEGKRTAGQGTPSYQETEGRDKKKWSYEDQWGLNDCTREDGKRIWSRSTTYFVKCKGLAYACPKWPISLNSRARIKYNSFHSLPLLYKKNKWFLTITVLRLN